MMLIQNGLLRTKTCHTSTVLLWTTSNRDKTSHNTIKVQECLLFCNLKQE